MIAVTVEMRELREKYPARPGRVKLQPGDRVLVATSTGLEIGSIIETGRNIHDKKIEMKVVRALTEDDYRILRENRKKSEEVKPEIMKAVREENLNMCLTKVCYTYDRQKLFVYYTAPERIDFRNLIRNLGGKYKIRIQMVQIGIRNEAAVLGGIGPCGEEICCKRFLRNIDAVNIDMARNQHLSLNSDSVSGCCGRLLCCLRYENEYYNRAKARMPKEGEKVNTPDGPGTVCSVNCVDETVNVKLKSSAVSKYNLKDIEKTQKVKDRIKKWIK